MIGFLFPGQGSQHETMLAHREPHLEDSLAQARSVLGFDLRAAFAGRNAVHDTRLVQLALLVAGVASARRCIDAAIVPGAVAGHSSGAFGAAVIAGVLAFDDALRIVERRGALMTQMFPAGFGMAAIVGLDAAAVDALIAETARDEALSRSNHNAPRQFVLSGASRALERAVLLAPRRGAASARILEVTIPSHGPLAAPIAAELHAEFDRVRIAAPSVRIAGNVNGTLLRSGRAVLDDALDNVAHPVDWVKATEALVEAGVRLFVEMEPGHVLRDLAGAAFPDVRAVALEDGLDDVVALHAKSVCELD